MRKLFVALLYMLLAGFCACGSVDLPEVTTAEPTKASSTADNKTSENDPYSNLVRTLSNDIKEYSDELEQLYYALYDIDGNGAAELFVFYGTSGNELLGVYVIQDGIVRAQREFFRPYTDLGIRRSLLFKNGTIKIENDDGGVYHYYFRFEYGTLKFQIELIDDEGEYFIYSDRKRNPISKEEFEQLQKELEGDGQTVELDWKPLAEYGR